MNNQINKNTIKNRDNDSAIVNTAIKLADDERNVINKPKIRQRAQVGKTFSTATHERNNSIMPASDHVQFKSKPSIATYQKQTNTPMLTYDLGAQTYTNSEKCIEQN